MLRVNLTRDRIAGRSILSWSWKTLKYTLEIQNKYGKHGLFSLRNCEEKSSREPNQLVVLVKFKKKTFTGVVV